MLNFPICLITAAIDLEKSIGKFFKYGLIILAVATGLGIVIRIVGSYIYFHTGQKIKNPGTRKVEILEINKEIVDDTLARAVLGYMIAGERGALFGAITGEQYEETKSITFRIYYNNGTEQTITCSPKHPLCQELLKKCDLW
ncbi:MAG: hypothetical protein ACOX3P_04985 [Saccharofermentanales bacterium]|nr:hypothetical protein [Bacillota bacterium]NLB09410.1 hypothetical protein [Clostridiales bacterium]